MSNGLAPLPDVSRVLAPGATVAAMDELAERTWEPGLRRLDRNSALSRALPGYEIGLMLGRGQHGVVFAGRHVALGREVAIKQLWPDLLHDADARRRFGREARLLASLDHLHIVRVYDYVEEGVHALVLERASGGTLQARLERGRIPSRSASTGHAGTSDHSQIPG
jgi:serine/threonine protein kinase